MRSHSYVLVVLALGSFNGSEAAATMSGVASAYESFRAKYGREEAAGSATYAERLAIFAKSAAKVEAHNSQSGISWRATINKFADYTEAEYKALLGYCRVGHWWAPRHGQSFLQQVNPNLRSSSVLSIGSEVDWRSNLNSSKFFRDQGSCGSCWAVAAAGALEMHMEIATKKPAQKLSFQELVDCVPNPKHCGGEGGCKGATAELAFQYVKEHGLSVAANYADGDVTATCQPKTKSGLRSGSFVKLPENKFQPLLVAVANKGPVVVSVDAGSWSFYDSGVFDGCDRDATINHAVLLVGFGHDKDTRKDYWIIRNSWGDSWGESGFMRLQRHSHDTGVQGYCGIDHDPKVGVGCDGGPSSLPVCGMCGILSDTSYPTDLAIEREIV